MRKTHKKILGFAGLGLVAATTAVAATIPSPIAAAVAAGTDVIQIRVVPSNPDISIVVESSDIVTSPTYDFGIQYSGLAHYEVELVNYNEDGEELYRDIIWSEDLDGSEGAKPFSINLANYGGYGNFLIIARGRTATGVEMEQNMSFSYIVANESATTNPDNGEATVDATVPDDTATQIDTNIYSPDGTLARVLKTDITTGITSVYDPSGNLLFTVTDGYKDGKLVIPMEGLPYADGYNAKIVFRNDLGKQVGGVILVRIDHKGKEIIVPDTGSFFQGLNISREDYLITGLIAFMVIGVVAFGVVRKAHGVNASKRSGKINGRNRR